MTPDSFMQVHVRTHTMLYRMCLSAFQLAIHLEDKKNNGSNPFAFLNRHFIAQHLVNVIQLSSIRSFIINLHSLGT